MAEASKFYCQECSRATLYIGQKPKFCSYCGLNFLNKAPAYNPKGTSSAQVSNSFDIVDNQSAEIESQIEIDDTPAPMQIEEPAPPKAKKRGRPKKEKNKELSDISWFSQSAGTLRPNFRKQ